MLSIAHDPSGAVLAEIHGSLEPDDQRVLHDTIAAVISQRRQGRVLLSLIGIDYDEIDAEDVWYDVKPAAFLKGMVRMAVLTEPAAMPAYEKFTFFAPFRTRLFPLAEREAALAWLISDEDGERTPRVSRD